MSKICKNGYMEMTKKIYLETLRSVLGRSLLHYYWCLLIIMTITLLKRKSNYHIFFQITWPWRVDAISIFKIVWASQVYLASPVVWDDHYPYWKSVTWPYVDSIIISFRISLNITSFLEVTSSFFSYIINL